MLSILRDYVHFDDDDSDSDPNVSLLEQSFGKHYVAIRKLVLDHLDLEGNNEDVNYSPQQIMSHFLEYMYSLASKSNFRADKRKEFNSSFDKIPNLEVILSGLSRRKGTRQVSEQILMFLLIM